MIDPKKLRSAESLRAEVDEKLNELPMNSFEYQLATLVLAQKPISSMDKVILVTELGKQFAAVTFATCGGSIEATRILMMKVMNYEIEELEKVEKMLS